MAFFTDILRSAVSSIRVETAYGPTIDIPDPFADTPEPNALASFMKPTLTFNAGTANEYVLAPYGVSHGESWPLVQAMILAAGLVLGGFVLKKMMHKR